MHNRIEDWSNLRTEILSDQKNQLSLLPEIHLLFKAVYGRSVIVMIRSRQLVLSKFIAFSLNQRNVAEIPVTAPAVLHPAGANSPLAQLTP